MTTRMPSGNRKVSGVLSAMLALSTMLLTPLVSASAQQFAVLYDFQGGGNGKTPWSAVTLDSSGNLYGTTRYGGVDNCNNGGLGCGIAYQISPPTGQGQWTETVLYTFTNGSDGASPYGGLVADGAGNFYGTAAYGGKVNTNVCGDGCGVVFELSPAGNGTWTETVLYTFEGYKDGANPFGTLVRDSSGNLYGTAIAGGVANPNFPLGSGVVFELSPGSNGWTYTVLYAFKGYKDGSAPFGGVIFDNAGNLYGTTTVAGSLCECGTVFRLSPSTSGWTLTTLHIFNGVNGNDAQGPLAFDASGNLYGTTVFGGPPQGCDAGCGLTFELTPSSSGFWTESTVHVFNQNGPFYPSGSLVFDSAGNLYGTVQASGIYRMSQVAGKWRQSGFFTVPPSIGNTPIGGLISDSSGNLYGTASNGGTSNSGIVFRFTP
jgi:uncharacterized repeat protein (TIGR03803 family)